MKEKSMRSHGKGRVGFVSRLLMMISLCICVIVITQGCEQVTMPTVTSCYDCILNLQKAISEALQKNSQEKVQTSVLGTNGKSSRLTLSRSDLVTFQSYLASIQSYLSNYRTLHSSSETNITNSSSTSPSESPPEHNPTSAITTLNEQYNMKGGE